MISIQVIPDRFTKAEQTANASIKQSTAGADPFIRRPTRGIVLKEETFATLRVVSGSGENKLLVDAGSRRGPGKNKFHEIDGKRATDVYSNFFLQGIQEERQEKQQILETFGEAYIFLYGERARIITFTGVLLNTFDFNWEAEWWHNYENYLRGTRCVENDCRVFLSFDETLVSGYIIGSAASKDVSTPNHVNFQFQLFITSYSNFSKIGVPNAADGETEPLIVEGDGDLSPEMANFFRPNIIDPNAPSTFNALGDKIVRDGNRTDTPNLIEGFLRSGLAPIVKTFNTAQQIANTALQKLSNLMAGEVIRVPIGFEGSLAFDAEDVVSIREITGGGKIIYSTFDQNEDEYVGRGTHYGSSQAFLGTLSDPYESLLEEQSNSIKYTLDRARQIWADHGLEVPANQLGPISAFIAGKGLGLLAVGATAAWRSQKPDVSSIVKIRG